MQNASAVTSVLANRVSRGAPRAPDYRVVVAAVALAALAPTNGLAQAPRPPRAFREVYVTVDHIAREAAVFGVDSMAIVRQITAKFALADIHVSPRGKDSCAVSVQVTRAIGGGEIMLTVLMRRFVSGATKANTSATRSEQSAYISSFTSIPSIVATMVDRQLVEFIRAPRAPG